MASIELLTVAEVSKILKCNVDYVYKLKKIRSAEIHEAWQP